MTAEVFHSIFDQMNDPVLLRSGEDWLLNPAAQALRLTDAELGQLADWSGDAYIWLSLRFYHVSVQRVDGEAMFLLRQDGFLSELTENISSQIRLRLQSAFGCVADLSRVGALRSNLKARERLCGISRELYRLLRMTQELELAGQPELSLPQPDCYDLVFALTQLGDELRELLRPTEVEFRMELEPKSLVLTADPSQIKYMLLCLVSNALPHLPSTGGRVALGLKEQNGQAILTVSDNGDGFSPDLLSNPLWSQPHRLVLGRGLGLGLPLVQRIAAAHDGKVMVFPSSKGSRVTVSIPIRLPTDHFAQPRFPDREAGGFSQAKVLLSNALPRSVYFPNPDGDET